MAGGSGRRADAIIVAAGSSSRMAGHRQAAAPIADRPLLAWSLGVRGAATAVDRIVVVVAAARADEVLGRATWLPAGAAVVAGGDRRQESVAAGFAAARPLVVSAGRRRRRPGPRRGAAAGLARARRRGRSRRRLSRCGDPRRAGRRDAQAVHGERVGGTVDREGPRGRPDAPGRAPRAPARRGTRRFPPEGAGVLDRRGRPARGLYDSRSMSSPANPTISR